MSLQDDLYELYLLDQQVRGLERRLEGARDHVREHERRLERLQQQRQELDEQLRRTQATETNLEREAEDTQQRIDKLREQMNSAKTDREYKGFLVEVNTLKSDKAKVEDRALELMNDVERQRQQLEETDQQIEQQQKVKTVADRELQSRREEVGDQLERLKQQREEAAQKVPAEARTAFDRLADQLDGEAMAEVDQPDPRQMEYICGGCFMTIPAEKVNQLIAHDKLVRCSSCSRILYLSQDLKENMGIRSS